LRTQLANALTLAARTDPVAPQAPDDSGQKIPDFPDYSASDRTLVRGWITQPRLVIRHKTASFPDQLSKMRYQFNRLRRIAFDQILPHIRDDGMIGLRDLLSIIQLLEAAFRHPYKVATTEWKMPEIKHKRHVFPQYYVEFQVIAANHDWN